MVQDLVEGRGIGLPPVLQWAHFDPKVKQPVCEKCEKCGECVGCEHGAHDTRQYQPPHKTGLKLCAHSTAPLALSIILIWHQTRVVKRAGQEKLPCAQTGTSQW